MKIKISLDDNPDNMMDYIKEETTRALSNALAVPLMATPANLAYIERIVQGVQQDAQELYNEGYWIKFDLNIK